MFLARGLFWGACFFIPFPALSSFDFNVIDSSLYLPILRVLKLLEYLPRFFRPSRLRLLVEQNLASTSVLLELR
mgnify:CR=1 FL=1